MWGRRGKGRAEETRAAALDLLRTELEFVYREFHAALSLGQNLFRWGFGIFGVLLAAALAAQGALADKPNPPLSNAIWLVVDIGLPAVVWASAIAWIGEHARLVRAGRYLAALEARVSEIEGLTDALGFRPLGWQTWVLRPRRFRWVQQVPYLGVAGAYGFAALTAHVVAWFLGRGLIQSAYLTPAEFSVLFWIGIGGSAVGLVLCLLLGIWLFSRHTLASALRTEG